MSYIAFTSPHDERLLRGTERAYAGAVVNDLAATLTTIGAGVTLLHSYLNPAHYGASRLREMSPYDQRLTSELRTTLGFSPEPILMKDGEPLDSFDYSLNTALVAGSDPVRLLTRLHGQCEVHAWVDGPDRAWLADIIDEGVETGVLRSNTVAPPQVGRYYEWSEIAEFLRSDDTTEVVTSYSVTEGFPDPRVIGWVPSGGVPDDDDGDAISDAWAELSREEQWSIGMAYLRESSGTQLQPSDWATVRFGHKISAFNLITPTP